MCLLERSIKWPWNRLILSLLCRKMTGSRKVLPFLYYVSGGIKACVFLNVDIHATVIAYVPCGKHEKIVE